MFVAVIQERIIHIDGKHFTRSKLYLTNVAASEANIIFSGRTYERSSIDVNKRRILPLRAVDLPILRSTAVYFPASGRRSLG